MAELGKIQRFRMNPVELIIFMAVSVFFLKSVYNLFYDNRLVTSFTASASSNRKLASIPMAPILEIDFKCDGMSASQTAANQLRISGPLCGYKEGQPSQISILNQANQFTATVFHDRSSAEKFLTDTIPLVKGRNTIQLEFLYPENKVSRELIIHHNPSLTSL